MEHTQQVSREEGVSNVRFCGHVCRGLHKCAGVVSAWYWLGEVIALSGIGQWRLVTQSLLAYSNVFRAQKMASSCQQTSLLCCISHWQCATSPK
jgi:hypothetical protein